MDRIYHWHFGGCAVGDARPSGALGMAVLSAGQRAAHRLGVAHFCRWAFAAAAGLFTDQRARTQTQRSFGGHLADHEKSGGQLPRAREEREARGLTYAQMGQVLGLGEHQIEAGAVQGYESGMPARNGSVVRIYQGLQRARLQGCVWLGLPRFTIARDGQAVVLHHNEWPRFVAKAVPEKLHKEQWRFARAGMPVYELRPSTGLAQMIFSYLDHVPEGVDVEDVLEEAIAALEGFVLFGGSRG